MAPAVGFYDQAHMINEFRAFAGAPPTVFFQPHGDGLARPQSQLRGRPGEWGLTVPEDRSKLSELTKLAQYGDTH